jgi:hypothetical protein
MKNFGGRIRGYFCGSSEVLSKPQSRSEADFCRPGPLTGRVFAFSINTHVKYYNKTVCVALKTKAKARHVRGHGLHNTFSINGL